MGLINVPAIVDGNTADDDLWNSRFAIIVNEINGNIGTANLQDGAVTTAKLGSKAVTAAKIEDQEAWIVPTMLNSWVNYDTSHESVGYFKDSMGIVHLKGLIKSGTVGQNAFVLPVGYRPAKHQHFAIAANATIGICRVGSDGSVKPETGSNLWFGLNGITFKAEA